MSESDHRWNEAIAAAARRSIEKNLASPFQLRKLYKADDPVWNAAIDAAAGCGTKPYYPTPQQIQRLRRDVP